MSIRISAIICTYNRAAYLQKAIQSLVDQALSTEQYEIIVVDNGSTDNTKAIVEGFKRLKHLRYIYEPILGLSQARNTGWQNAQGEYVAYMDDDAIACPDWLERIVNAFDTVQPRPGSVGGKVIPIWEVARPAWLPKELERTLSVVDWAESPTFLTEGYQFLAGTNVAYPRNTMQRLGGFSTSLGRKSSSLLSNEEILMKRLLERGSLGIYYDPDIFVYHHIPAERLSKRWLYRRAFWQGASDAILLHVEACQTEGKGRSMFRSAVDVLPRGAILKGLPSTLFSAVLRNRVLARWRLYACLGRAWMQLRIALGLEKVAGSEP